MFSNLENRYFIITPFVFKEKYYEIFDNDILGKEDRIWQKIL